MPLSCNWAKSWSLAQIPTIFFHSNYPYTRALLSAVPTLEAKPFNSAECLLEGEPPSPINLPIGCSFAPRCPAAVRRCSELAPELQSVAGGTAAACFVAQHGGSIGDAVYSAARHH